jgi:hypothetical protein
VFSNPTISAVQEFIDQDLIPWIRLGKFPGFVRDNEDKTSPIFTIGTGHMPQPPKALNTSNIIFNIQTTKSIEDILRVLTRTGGANAKEAWILHLVKETELEDPYEEDEEEEEIKEKKKGKGKGKAKNNPRTASMDVSSNSKRRVRNSSFFVRTRLD